MFLEYIEASMMAHSCVSNTREVGEDQVARSSGLNENAASVNKTKLTNTPIYKPMKCLSGHYRKYTLAMISVLNS